MNVLLVTGGAGFIGSNFIKHFLKINKDFILVNLDKLTYAGNLNNLKEIEEHPGYFLSKAIFVIKNRLTGFWKSLTHNILSISQLNPM